MLRIAGKWIPIVPVYGYRDFVDSVEWYRGLVRNLKDAARLFNMQVSQLAEYSASSGSDTPLFEPDQMPKKVSEHWADRTNKPWLPVKSLRDEDGNIVTGIDDNVFDNPFNRIPVFHFRPDLRKIKSDLKNSCFNF